MPNNKIAIYGSGAFGREVAMLIEQINEATESAPHAGGWDLVGFFDDATPATTSINGYAFLGNMDTLNQHQEKLAVVIAVGNPVAKRNIHLRIANPNIYYPTLIHPTVLTGKKELVSIGEGCIITAYNVITVNVHIGRFVILNLTCTVGHDCIIGDYVSVMPGVNISGSVSIKEGVYLGTNATIINNLEVGENTIVGAGAVVSKSLPANCTAVGVPAKPIKYRDNS